MIKKIRKAWAREKSTLSDGCFAMGLNLPFTASIIAEVPWFIPL